MEGKRVRFEAQVLPHLDAAYRFARWLSRSNADADDLTQEAVLKAYQAFDALKSTDAKPWLLSIVRNCHASAYRRQQRLVPLPDDGELPAAAPDAAANDPESLSMHEDEERRLTRLMGVLAPEHREVLMLREIEELSYREISAVTRLPIGTVMSRLARARAALKTRWLEERKDFAHGLP